MSRLSRGFGIAALVLGIGACNAMAQQATSAPTPGKTDAVALQEFRQRVEQYVALHEQLAKKSPPPQESKDPAKFKAAQQVFAETMQVARKNAKPGDIFTPAVQATFKRMIRPELKGSEGRETKAIIKEDAPAAGSVTLKVNAHYPETQPLSTVPPNLLARLPQLPEQLEYRIVGTHLILRDTMANLIVDYMPNAIY